MWSDIRQRKIFFRSLFFLRRAKQEKIIFNKPLAKAKEEEEDEEAKREKWKSLSA